MKKKSKKLKKKNKKVKNRKKWLAEIEEIKQNSASWTEAQELTWSFVFIKILKNARLRAKHLRFMICFSTCFVFSRVKTGFYHFLSQKVDLMRSIRSINDLIKSSHLMIIRWLDQLNDLIEDQKRCKKGPNNSRYKKSVLN